MKVLILANSDSGLYRFRKELIKKLIQLNHTVFVSVPEGDCKDKLQELGCVYIPTKFDRRGMNPIKDLALFNEYKRLISKYQPDLVITYTIKCNIYGGFAARIKKIPYVINITGLGSAFEKEGFIKAMVSGMYKVASKNARTIFFENEGDKEKFVGLKLAKDSKCHVLHGAGVNLNDFEVLEPSTGNDTGLLFIGRIMHEKGVDELFEVAKYCKEQNLPIRFDFIGFYEENYKEQVELYQKQGIINFYGYQENIVPYVKNVDAVILPSYHEGMSNSLLEGAAMGRALLTSNIHGCMEAVDDGKTGYLFEVKDSKDLLDKVIKFSKLSKEEKVKMGLNGRKFIEEHFDKNKVVEETISYLGI